MTPHAMAKRIELWPIDRLIPYAKNPRTHSDSQVAQIAASIAEFGFNNPVLVDTKDGIIAGHGRLLAARKLKLDQVPVVVLDHLTETQKRAYILADNRLAELAGWDEELLRGELAELRDADFNLDLIGFDEDELERLLAEEPGDGLTEEDAVPEPLNRRPPAAAISGFSASIAYFAAIPRTARTWTAWWRARRLIWSTLIRLTTCASSRRSNNAIAAGVSSFTNLQHHQSLDVHRHPSKAKGTTKKMRPKDRALANDFMKDGDYDALLRQWFANLAGVLKPGGSFYIWGGYANCANYPPALAECELYFSQAIIWVKEHPVLTRKDFMGNHEWCFYGWREGAAHWFNPEIKNATDVWSVKKVNPTAMVHLTEKPVELAIRALTYSSRSGQTVLDLFGGSGSTLIAAEKLGRKARLMEIDPPYCDVILRRWQEYTGAKAVLEGDGRDFDEVREERVQVAA
jgi:DNA modification methylase